MLIELIKDDRLRTKFNEGQYITNGNYDFTIGNIIPCTGGERAADINNRVCHFRKECSVRLAYVSAQSGCSYCSRNENWKLVAKNWRE